MRRLRMLDVSPPTPRDAAPASSGRRLGSGDCERLRDGWVAQPVNAASSLALVAAGGVLWRWMMRRSDVDARPAAAIAVGLALAGLGSADYHGTQSPLAQWGHDWGIAAPIVAAVHLDARALHPAVDGRVVAAASAAVLGGVGLLLARRPHSGPAVAAAASLLLAAAELGVWRRGLRPGPRAGSGRLLAVAATATLVGTTAQTLNRTGGPLCRPDSVWQGHAVSHAASAVALASWAMAVAPPPTELGVSA
jgi:hypothetical protein